MILLWIALLFFVAFWVLILESRKKVDKHLKYIIIVYAYALIFVYYAKVTNDPIQIPYVGEISADFAAGIILASSSFVISKLYDFFMSIKKEISTVRTELSEIKNSFEKHTAICNIRHEELEKRIVKPKK